ncbi:MAG: hypothetical protein FWD23_18940 [Oscillospiraceae bacterium]|nr:hypothetical protein [Oscillospiraceae bacterium]
MKKLSFLLSIALIAPVFIFILAGCGTIQNLMIPYNEPPLPIFTHYMEVPDFLDREQQTLYRKAFVVYGAFWHGNDGVEYFPLKKGQEKILSDDDLALRVADLWEYEPELIINNAGYIESHGRYRDWSEFEKVNMVVFTPEYFEELNQASKKSDDGSGIIEYKHFLDFNDKLYYAPLKLERREGYAGVETDAFELISSSESEIKFNLIVYCKDDKGNLTEQPPNVFEIILTKTNNGWRFSKFYVGW